MSSQVSSLWDQVSILEGKSEVVEGNNKNSANSLSKNNLRYNMLSGVKWLKPLDTFVKQYCPKAHTSCIATNI